MVDVGISTFNWDRRMFGGVIPKRLFLVPYFHWFTMGWNGVEQPQGLLVSQHARHWFALNERNIHTMFIHFQTTQNMFHPIIYLELSSGSRFWLQVCSITYFQENAISYCWSWLGPSNCPHWSPQTGWSCAYWIYWLWNIRVHTVTPLFFPSSKHWDLYVFIPVTELTDYIISSI